MQIVEDPIGRAARVELKDPRKMAVATEQLNNREVGDGDTIERCTLQAELFGGEDMPEQLNSLGPMRRTLFIDELPMPKRPDVGPGDRDREVYLQNLPPNIVREDQLRPWVERFGPVDEVLLRKDDLTDTCTGTAYVRFSEHDGAAACVEANSSVAEGEPVAMWSESERAAQRSLSVYRADLTLAFAEPSGRILRSVMVRCKVNELWLLSEAVRLKDKRAPAAAAKQLHFSVECEVDEFEEMKAALGNVLEAFHEKATMRLRSLPPPRKASGTPGPPPGWQPAPMLNRDNGKGKGAWRGEADSKAASAAESEAKGKVVPPKAPKEPPPQAAKARGKGKGGVRSQDEAPQRSEAVPPKTPPSREILAKAKAKGGSKAGRLAPRISEEPQQDAEAPEKDAGRKRKWESGPGATQDTFAQGEAFVAEARAAAARGEKNRAYMRFCQGLELLVDCAPTEEEQDEESVRRRELITGYMQEAEELKAHMDSAKLSEAGKPALRPAPGRAAEVGGATPGKAAFAPKGGKGQPKNTIQSQYALLRTRVVECEAIMQGAYDLESQGLADQAYEEYCKGLKTFVPAARKIAEDSADKEVLKKQLEFHLGKAPRLKERIAKAGLSISSLVTPPDRQQAPPKQAVAGAAAAGGKVQARAVPSGPRPALPVGGQRASLQPRQMAPRAVPAQEARPEASQPAGADRGRGRDTSAVSKAASLRAAAPVKAMAPKAPGPILPAKRPLPVGPAVAGAKAPGGAVAWGSDGIPPQPTERHLPRPGSAAGKPRPPSRPPTGMPRPR